MNSSKNLNELYSLSCTEIKRKRLLLSFVYVIVVNIVTSTGIAMAGWVSVSV
jgi:hypothetical protein